MIMLVDISKLDGDLTDLSNDMKDLGEKIGVQIHVMHEDIFNTMHRI